MNRAIYAIIFGPFRNTVMSRAVFAELALNQRHRNTRLTRWLYQELRDAILERRLDAGCRLPASRDLARKYGISRGTVVTAFERLQAEGYVVSRVGSGTRVTERLPGDLLRAQGARRPLTRVRGSLTGGIYAGPARPFRAYEPALAAFPMHTWARVAGRTLRGASVRLLAGGDARGYEPLREAIAAYLGSSRGVKCSPDQVAIVTGAQQGLDLLLRCAIEPGDSVWMEDPGYFGALRAFRNLGAKVVAVPTDESGLAVSVGKRMCNRAAAVYLTPAHQFLLGMTMSLDRRLAILAWAREVGALVIEDDYDSEFRFEGQPVPALQGLDDFGSVALLGSFNKMLFPSLRIGYVVLPQRLIEAFLSKRLGVDLHPSGLDQAVLCEFIADGHFGRHVRRMRDLYGQRLSALHEAARKHLKGLLDVLPIQAGLNTAGLLKNGMTSRQAETAATARGLETMALSRFALVRSDVSGLLLGFAAFDGIKIRSAVATLAAALEKNSESSRFAGGARRRDSVRERSLV